MDTPIEHTTFVVRRTLSGSPQHAFRFWSDPKLKSRWTGCHADWTVLEEAFDFVEGGEEVKRWRTPDGDELHFRATYFDIDPEKRIVYGYEMSFGGERLSVSLVTIELCASGAKTDVTVTEQAVFFGAGIRGQRVAGTEEGYERLVAAADEAVFDA